MDRELNHSDCAWDIDAVMADLEALYKGHASHATAWSGERDELRLRVQALCAKLSGRYRDPHAMGVGGSGVVLRLTDGEMGDQPAALKFPRPVRGREEELATMIGNEAEHLGHLRHTNIIRVLGSSQVPIPNGDSMPYFVMDWIDGSNSIAFLSRSGLPGRADDVLAQIVGLTLGAVAYLHEHDILHLDIKPDNIYLDATARPILGDLGTAKYRRSGADETIVAFTAWYAHPQLAAAAINEGSVNRVFRSVERSDLNAQWDLFALGKTILRWLGFEPDLETRLPHPDDKDVIAPDNPPHFELSAYHRKFLMLMAARLLDGHVPSWLEVAIGLKAKWLEELKYNDVHEALADISKLTGEYSLYDHVPELDPLSMAAIQVGPQPPVAFTARLGRLLELPLMRRLASITQLGVLSHVYPTASHSRFEHSLGTYANACRFVASLYFDPLSPFFRQVMNEEDVRSVLVSALLHDIGQFPLAHDLEEIDKDTFSHKRIGLKLLTDDKLAALLRAGNSRSHATRQSDVSTSPWGGVSEPTWEVDPDRIRAILDAGPRASLKDQILHSIIDGPLDADKVDYLLRDATRLSLPYPLGIDVDRLLRNLTIVIDDHGSGMGNVAFVGVHEKARVPADFVGIARAAMFSQGYWHHTVRAMKAMLARAVIALDGYLASRGPALRRGFIRDFERFVEGLPGILFLAPPLQESLDLSLGAAHQGKSRDNKFDPFSLERISGEVARTLQADRSGLADTDVGVLEFLRQWLTAANAPEQELLSDLRDRKLYKRVATYSHARSDAMLRQLVQDWHSLSTPQQKLRLFQLLESHLASIAATGTVKTTTGAVSQDQRDALVQRHAAQLPILLIDLPSDRGYAAAGMPYVEESQRIDLRHDNRAVGDPLYSKTSLLLANESTKLRLFAHSRCADVVHAAVAQATFLDVWQENVDAARQVR